MTSAVTCREDRGLRRAGLLVSTGSASRLPLLAVRRWGVSFNSCVSGFVCKMGQQWRLSRMAVKGGMRHLRQGSPWRPVKSAITVP